MIKFFRTSIMVSIVLSLVAPIQNSWAAPATPANIQVRIDANAAYDHGTITVTWDALTGASGYSVLITKEDDQTTERLSVTGAQNTTAEFNTLKGGKSYIVQVRSIVIDQASAWSSDTLKVVPKTAPKAPNKPSATVGVGKATVSWSAVVNADSGGFDVSSYIIREVSTGTSVTAAATATSADVMGLTAGSAVEFTVTAINAANSTGTTSTKSDAVTIPSAPAVMSAPSMVAQSTDGQAGVSWVAPASNGGNAIVSYTVKLLKGGVDLFSRVVTDLATLTTLFDNLATGSYSAKVASTNGVGSSAFSLESSSLQVTRLIPVDTSTSTTSSGSSSAPAGGVGGGFGGAPAGGAGTTWINIFIADPENLTMPYPGEACVIFIHKLKEGDKQYGPHCTNKAGAIDFEAYDGDYQIRAYDKEDAQHFKEYFAKVTYGSFEVSGAGYRGGSVPRRVITVLSKTTTPTPSPTTTASASATPTPSASPSVTAKPSPTTSPSASPTSKLTSIVIGGKVTGAIRSSTLTSTSTKVSLKLSANFQAVIPTAKKGDKIFVTFKDSKGKSYIAPAVKVAKSGTVRLPSVKFNSVGKYTITIRIGTKTKTVTITATK